MSFVCLRLSLSLCVYSCLLSRLYLSKKSLQAEHPRVESAKKALSIDPVSVAQMGYILMLFKSFCFFFPSSLTGVASPSPVHSSSLFVMLLTKTILLSRVCRPSETSSSSSSSSSAGSAVCLSDLPSSLSVKIANAKQATLERSVQDRLIPHLEKSVEDLGALLRCIQAAKSSARQNLSTLRTNTKTPSLGRICQAIQKELQEEEEEKE